MKTVQIEATVKAKDGMPQLSETCTYSLGENLEELVKQFGEGVIFNQSRGAIVVALQGYMRNQMTVKEGGKAGGPKKGPALQAAVTKWKPGQRLPGKPAAEKFREQFEKLEPAAKAALLRELQKNKAA